MAGKANTVDADHTVLFAVTLWKFLRKIFYLYKFWTYVGNYGYRVT